jgi:pyridoxamine 5'-phosphate oxidase
MMTTLRERLRATPTVTGRPPAWDLSSSPSDPRDLFIEWLTTALDAGVGEPLATVLSTIAADGAPDSRTLLLKDVTGDFGLVFATGAESRKSTQLDADPRCALTLYWSPLARAVRIRGIATRGSWEEASADFLARHPDARAVALVGRQSSAMTEDDRHAELINEQRRRIEADPGLVASNWTVWHVMPTQVEFWQAAPSRDHLRVRYERRGATWTHERLWP